MYVILTKYIKPIEEVNRVVGSHRAFLDTLYADGILLASGPQIPRTGGVLLAKGMDRTELTAHLDKDPFVTEGISEYSLIEFEPVKHLSALKDLI